MLNPVKVNLISKRISVIILKCMV